MNLPQRTEAALNQAREEAPNALRTKTKEFAGADGLPAFPEAEMKLGVLQEKAAPLPKTAPKLRKREAEKAKSRCPKTQRTRQLQNRSTCRPSTCATPCCPITATKRVL